MSQRARVCDLHIQLSVWRHHAHHGRGFATSDFTSSTTAATLCLVIFGDICPSTAIRRSRKVGDACDSASLTSRLRRPLRGAIIKAPHSMSYDVLLFLVPVNTMRLNRNFVQPPSALRSSVLRRGRTTWLEAASRYCQLPPLTRTAARHGPLHFLAWWYWTSAAGQGLPRNISRMRSCSSILLEHG